MAETFVVGGNETTTFLLSSIFLRLAQDPQLADRARADHAIIPALIDEMLRLESPAQGVFRSARRDVNLRGKTIPGGAIVFFLLGSGNRDEETFNDAAEPNLDRNPSEAVHLAFGRGQHFCLARSEVRIALEVFLPRMHDLRLEPGGTVLRTQSMMLRGLARLDLTYNPA